MSEKDRLRQIIEATKAEQIVQLNSDQVTDLIEESADGKIKIYGEKGKYSGSSSRRTEIQADGGIVKVHKDTGVAKGLYSMASRYSRVEVISEDKTASLRVSVDPDKSQSNPVYIFEEVSGDENKQIGLGYGQSIDLEIADRLLKTHECSGGNYVDPKVIEWIESKLQ